MSVEQKIKEIVADHVGCSEDRISLDSTWDSLGLDSLDITEIVMEIEESCDIEMNDDVEFDTLADVVKYVEENGPINRERFP